MHKNKTPKYFFGIKNNSEDFTRYFEYILDSSPKYIVASSFSFWLPYPLWSKIKSLECPKVIIMCYEYLYETKTHTLVKEDLFNQLINANFSVIINSKNHCKFLLTDKHLYQGSNNLSGGGIIQNAENSTFINPTHPDFNFWTYDILNYSCTCLMNYGNLDFVKIKEDALAHLFIPEILFFMTEQQIKTSINTLDTIMDNLKSTTDSYQLLDKDFFKLYRKTLSTMTLLDNFKYNLLYNLTQNKSSKICISNFDKLKKDVFKLENSFKNLTLYRSILRNSTLDNWKNKKQIIKNPISNNISKNIGNIDFFLNTISTLYPNLQF